MAQTVKHRPGVPSSEKELEESKKGFSGVEESIALLYKKGVKKCESCSSSRKKPSKK